MAQPNTALSSRTRWFHPGLLLVGFPKGQDLPPGSGSLGLKDPELLFKLGVLWVSGPFVLVQARIPLNPAKA